MQQTGRFRQILGSGKFIVSLQAWPPRGVNLEGFLKTLETVKDKADSIIIPDCRGAGLSLGSTASLAAANSKGIPPIAVLSCRDRNRLALCAELLGFFSLGVDAVLCVTGDHVSLGDMPDAKTVYDLDSVQLIGEAKALESGIGPDGIALEGVPQFFIGCAANPSSSPVEPHLMKLEKKIRAGAEFIVTLEVYQIQAAIAFLQRLKKLGVKVIVGLRLMRMEDLASHSKGIRGTNKPPEALMDSYREKNKEYILEKETERLALSIRELKSTGLCSGVHLNLCGHEALLKTIIDHAGI